MSTARAPRPHTFRGLALARRAWPQIERAAPGIALLRHYPRKWLRRDLVAGLVLSTLLVPQGMAYAQLAGLPPVTGLYTTIACLVGYALTGPSRILVLGPDSAVSPMILAAITPLLGATKDSATAIALAGMLAVLVGLIEIGLGVAKLGFVADLLSKEVKVGYMNGLAVVIIVGQLPKLCGFSTDASGFVNELRAFFSSLDETVPATLVVGLSCLLLLWGLPYIARAVPAILVVIAGATVVSAVLDLSSHGVATVGALPQGLPRPTVPWTSLGDVGPLFAAAVGITLVSLTDTIATSASFAARHRETVSPDREMIGVGISNVAAGFFRGFAISSSASRTAVAEKSKAKSQLTGLVGAGAVVVLLLFFNSLLAALPDTALAAVVIVAAVSLVDLNALVRYWHVRRSAVLISLSASLGVILLGVLPGILFAIALSILLFFRSNWWPHGEVLGRRHDGDWHALDDDHDTEQQSGVVVFRWEAPLFFANSGIFARQIWSLVQQQEPRWIVLQCQAITDIDVTAADMLGQLDDELNARGIHIAFVELRTRLHRQVGRYGLLGRSLDREHFYASVDQALAHISSAPAATPGLGSSARGEARPS
ncbi:MAG TPA: sulfate permease [Jatrophihabitans sp.]|nr:sulfate permease [Jatrophihabitans sp.]